MNLTGFLLEILMPGAIATIAIVLALFDANWVRPDTFAILNGLLGASAFSVCAYLNGLVLRHSTGGLWFLEDRSYYPDILKRDWPDLSNELVPILRSQLLAPPDWEPGFDAKKSASTAYGLIIYLREYIFANKQSMIGEFVLYQWNLIRLARNSFVPLLLLALAFALGILLRWQRYPATIPIFHCLGLFWSLGIALGTLKAYRERLLYLAGILMRTAAFEFKKHEYQLSRHENA